MTAVDQIQTEDFEIQKISVPHIDIDILDQCQLHFLIKKNEIQAGVFHENQGKQLLFESYKTKNTSFKIDASSFEFVVTNHSLFPANFWKSVTVGFSNRYQSFVPATLFEPSQKEIYIQQTIDDKLPLGYVTGFYKQPSLDIVNVFSYEKELLNLVEKLYPNASKKVVHESGSFLESCLFLANDYNRVFVNVNNNSFQLCIISDSKLIFFNTFSYRTKEDFVYYILHVYKDLNLDAEKEKITLWGEITLNSPLYDVLFKYVRFVEMGKRPSFVKFSFHFDELLDQRYFTLFSQTLCK